MDTQLPDYFWADKLTPLNYYGYTSATKDLIFEIDVHENKDVSVISRFHDLQRKCSNTLLERKGKNGEIEWDLEIWDNKIVIECETEQGEHIFVGYFDHTYSIGKSMYSVDGREPRAYRQI